MEDHYLLGLSLKDWAWILGGLLTFVGAWNGLREFTKSNRIKRAEFLEKLVTEFNESKFFLAKRILDDFWIDLESGKETSDFDMVRKGSLEKKEKAELNNLVTGLLRDHTTKSVTSYAEQQARQSFDDLLDFFAKVYYYRSIKLISNKELEYFIYYLQRCAFKANGAVMSYAITYRFPALFQLFDLVGIRPKNQDLYTEGLNLRKDKR